MQPTLLILIAMTPDNVAQIAQHFHIIHAPTRAERDAAIAHNGQDVRIVLTNGSTGLTGAEIAALPKLELACALGAGYENIDVETARARGVVVANGAGAQSQQSLGTVIFGGLVVATVLSLGVVPPFYVVIKGLEERLFGRKPTGGDEDGSLANAS